MSGYRRCLSIRQLNTSSLLLNAVAANRTSTAPSSSNFVRSGRRVLSEDDRRRTTSFNRRTNAATERFRQVQDERRLLIERHREAIGTDGEKNLSSIIETIEFNSAAYKDQLEDIHRLVKSKPTSLESLNDRQLSILIQAGGVFAQNVSPRNRQLYVQELWKLATERKAAIGVLSYNARIQAYIENGVEQNVVEVLKELNDAGIEADENTFSLLSKIYALKGQTAGILNIIELLKEQNLPATQPLFESLVYSFAYNKEDERVKTICQSLASNPAIDVSSLYVAAALGKARATKDVDEVLKIFVDIPTSVNFDRIQHFSKVIEIIVVLLENGVKDVVPKLRHYLYFDHTRGTIPYSAFITKEVFRLFNSGNEAGALELFPILDSKIKFKLREFFVEKLEESVFVSPEKAAALAEFFRNGKVFTKPLARVVQHAYMEKLQIFPFYQKFIESSEFKDFEDRSHVYYPLVINLCSRISALKIGDPERQPLFTQLFDTISKCNLFDAILKLVQAVVVSQGEDEKRLAVLLENNPSASFLIASLIAENMIYNNQLEKLEALLDGPLLNKTIYVNRVLPVVVRSLSRPGQIPDSEIRTIAKVIASGFSDQKTSATQDFGYRVIYDIFNNRFISDQRLTTLVRFLTETGKASLSKEEISKMSSGFQSENRTSARLELLKQLQSKSKTALRWLNSSLEQLEKEAAFLESEETKPEVKVRLYGIILEKLSDNSTISGKEYLEVLKKFNSIELQNDQFDRNKSYHVNVALRRCLLNGEIDAAKELWKMKKDTYDDIKLQYSLCLFNNGETEEAEKALESMRYLQHQVFTETLEMNVAPLHILEKFVDLVGRKRNLDQVTRKRAKKIIKELELRRAIDEDNLEKAFNVVSTYAKENRDVFGQLDLMSACIVKGNKAMLAQIFEIVAEKYDRNTASIDLMIAFLECGSFHSAEQVYKKAKNLFLSNAKTEFLIDREKKLKKPDVLHKLFLICTDPDSLAPSDAQVMLKECMDLYGKLENLDGLKELQNDFEKARFVDDFQKIKAHLESIIAATVNAKKESAARRRSASTPAGPNRSMSRNNSVFEHHDEKSATEKAST